jgi:hypothetical protein
MKLIKLFLIVLSFLYLSSCASFRTAEGLNGGEANIAFVAPATGALRVGLTDNIEARAMLTTIVLFSTEMYIHTKNDSGKINFGLTIGTHLLFNENIGYYVGPTIGIRLKNFYPYLTIIKNFTYSPNVKISLGSEIRISHDRLVLTPEIIMEIPPFNQVEGVNLPLYASLGIGYTFNFKKIFE